MNEAILASHSCTFGKQLSKFQAERICVFINSIIRNQPIREAGVQECDARGDAMKYLCQVHTCIGKAENEKQ